LITTTGKVAVPVVEIVLVGFDALNCPCALARVVWDAAIKWALAQESIGLKPVAGFVLIKIPRLNHRGN